MRTRGILRLHRWLGFKPYSSLSSPVWGARWQGAQRQRPILTTAKARTWPAGRPAGWLAVGRAGKAPPRTLAPRTVTRAVTACVTTLEKEVKVEPGDAISARQESSQPRYGALCGLGAKCLACTDAFCPHINSVKQGSQGSDLPGPSSKEVAEP